MMRYRFFFLFMFIALALNVGAQNAKQILDKTAATLRTNKGALQASFEATSATGSMKGTLCVQGNKFYLTSAQTYVWFDGKTQWTLLKGSDEVNVTTPTASEVQSINPYNIVNLYKKSYNSSVKTTSNGYNVHLVAQNANAAVKEMYITVAKSNYALQSVQLKQGKSWTTIKVNSVKNIGKKADSYFQFNKKDFPKVEVIDLR